jgi:predicted lactoylglutathione lyase
VKFAIEPGGNRRNSKKELDANPYLLQFLVGSKSDLDEMTTYLKNNGVQMLEQMRVTEYGLLSSFIDLDGSKLELLCKKL